MRNGNNAAWNELFNVPHSSYRTYEEWKLDKPESIISAKYGSYRTYEEWKPPDKVGFPMLDNEFLPYL